MRTSILFITALVCASVFAGCTKNSDQFVDTPLADRVDKVCDSIQKAYGVPGLLVGVWSEDKNLSFVKGYGYSNITTKAPMSAELAFRIGSNTKTMTITNILQLADEGKLTLDDTLGKYVTGIKGTNKVTLRMLCNMTAGYYDYTQSNEFNTIMETDPMRKWTNQDVLDIEKKYPMDFEPGSSAHYSNTNTALLGMVIEKITGKTLAENFKQRYFDKYQLNKTSMAVHTEYPYNGIRGYEKDAAGAYTVDMTQSYSLSWAGGAGGLISDIYDVKKWIELLVDGKMISAGMQEQRLQYPYPGIMKYGLGIFELDGMWGHNGGLPGFNSTMMRDPKSKLTIIVFMNYLNGDRTSNMAALQIKKTVEEK